MAGKAKSAGPSTKHRAHRGTEYRMMRDCMAGQSAVRAATTTYLPKTDGQRELEKRARGNRAIYQAYVARARFPDILSPIVSGFGALATQKPYEVENLPAAMRYLEEDAGCGIPLERWQASLLPEGLVPSQYALVADAKRAGEGDGKPRLSLYTAESILNWIIEDGRLVMLTVEEQREVYDDETPWESETESLYRVFQLVRSREPEPGEPAAAVPRYYRQRLYNEAGDLLDEWPFPEQEELPCVLGGATRCNTDPERPALIGVAEAQIGYYQLSAMYRQALYMSTNPTMFAPGFAPGTIEAVGAGVIVESAKTPTECGLQYVEITGAGMKHVADEMSGELAAAEQHSHRLREGAQREAADTLSTRVVTKTATLRSVDLCAAEALTHGLRSIARLMGLPGAERIVVRSAGKYTDEDIDATIVAALSAAVRENTLPREALFGYVRERGMLEGYTDAQIEQAILRAAAEFDVAPPPGDDDDDEDEQEQDPERDPDDDSGDA